MRRLPALLVSTFAVTGLASGVAPTGPAAAAVRKPDLTVKALRAPASLTVGAPVTVKVGVVSSRAAKGTRTLLLLSADRRRDKADIALNGRKGTATASARRQGTTTVKVRITVPAGTRAGTYRLIVCADAGAAVKERSEKNNCRVAAGSVKVLARAGQGTGTAVPPTPTQTAPAAPTTTTPPTTPTPPPPDPDTTPPAAPKVDATIPASPSSNPAPSVQLTGEPAARVDVYVEAACAGDVGVSITLPAGGTASLPVPVPHNVTSTLTAKAVDAAGNASPCSTVTQTYRHDDVAPATPLVNLSSPFLSGTLDTARYTGSAEAGSTVTGYDFGTSCSGAPDGTASAASFATSGIALDPFFGDAYFKATDAAGNASACAGPPHGGTYVRHSGIAQTEGAGDNNGRTGAGVVTLDIDDQRDEDAGVVDGTITAGDVDYFKVELPYSGYSLAVDLRSSDTVPCTTSMDPKLTLENGSGSPVAVNDDYSPSHYCSRLDGVTTASRLGGNRDLPAGTYYLRVEAVAGAPFDYRLVARPLFTADFEGPGNDTVAGATVVAGPHASLNANVSPTSDVDHYRVIAPSSGQLALDVLPGQGVGSPACSGAGAMDPYVDVMSADGSTVLASADDTGGGNLCSHLVKTGLTPGATYLVRVKRAPGASPMSATTFAYVLTVGP
jgi:hypothetical protein